MANIAENNTENHYDSAHYNDRSAASPLTWSQKMSNHIAYALLTYTGLQIFFGMAAIKGDSLSILPYFALVLLVAAVIPMCRNFERRWENMANDRAAHHAAQFRREAVMLWVSAIILPMVVVAIANMLRAVI